MPNSSSSRKRNKKSHFWTVQEKNTVWNSYKLGNGPSQIKKLFFKNDKTVKYRSITDLIYKIKQDPTWVNHSSNRLPAQENNNTPTISNRKSPRYKHFWTPEERQQIVDNIEKSAKWMKRNLFSSDRTINVKSIGMQAYNLQKGIITPEVGYVKTNSKKSKTRNNLSEMKELSKILANSISSVMSHSPLQLAYKNLQLHQKEVFNFNKQLLSQLSDSPYSKEEKAQLAILLKEQGILAVKNKETELLQSINKKLVQFVK